MASENSGFKFYREKLGCPRFILAPMVDQSELAWRMLSRKYGAELCYTPMLHASVFIKDSRYRKDNLVSCPEDRPLIVQFCASKSDVFVEACKLVVGHCDGVDLNLGCPQAIARRGHYGSFLQEEWDLLTEMVSRVHKEVNIPITCKIRVFQDISHTVKYAQMLEAAGCQILTVHGRTKEQKGPMTGIASWEHIKAVKRNVNIPVFANGNIQYFSDVEACFEATGVDGVMIAEGSLHNPALFSSLSMKIWDIVQEYIELAKLYPCPLSFVRGHIFKICHHCLLLQENRDIQQKIATANKIEEFELAISKLKAKYETQQCLNDNYDSIEKYNLPFPPWICQPYVRPPPSTENNKVDKHANLVIKQPISKVKRPVAEKSLSRKKLKKLQRNPEKQFGTKKIIFEKCKDCLNPKGSKCSFDLCKACCRRKSFKELLDCVGHKLLFKTKNKSINNDSLAEDLSIKKNVTLVKEYTTLTCIAESS